MTAYMDHKDLSNTAISGERAQEIIDAVHSTLDAVHEAEERAHRSVNDVTVLAATKTRDVAEILTAIDAGIRCIGENRPQEIIAKAQGLAEGLTERNLDISQHMIGQLQSNKISKILPHISVIESVDSLKLAERIARRVDENNSIGVYLEVNESGEDSKSGCAPEQALDLALEIASLPQIRLEGLMTIGAHVNDEKIVREGFAHLRSLREKIQEAGISSCAQLSMGMSADMEWAIQEGSTIVRVGTGIFGARAFI
ncbi:YggS family pyridoxal phosphate-dependent enzyme [Alloscardovia omnicolens]|uniref:YggS family pyridoxal phosphate-dependent enzyme n=1 Tax=Alloscardovia omnicolens TaxID=419015 RepID=UPI003A6BCE1D